jgi:hypothetical protein
MLHGIYAFSLSNLCNIKRLEAEFTHGYRIGANVFYVSLTNKKGGEKLILLMRKRNGGHFGMKKMRSLKNLVGTL